MENITNLATIGKYLNEINGLTISYDFEICNEDKVLTKINNGRVQDGENLIGSFNSGGYSPLGVKSDLQFNISKDREIEVVTAIVNALDELKTKISNGSIIN